MKKERKSMKKQARPGTRTDSRGNEIADVYGGPCDGDWFYSGNMEEGGSFVPARQRGMRVNRPVYLFKGGRFVFDGFDEDHECVG